MRSQFPCRNAPMHTHRMQVWLSLPLVTLYRVYNCVSLFDTCNEAHEAHMQSQRLRITRTVVSWRRCRVATVTRPTHNKKGGNPIAIVPQSKGLKGCGSFCLLSLPSNLPFVAITARLAPPSTTPACIAVCRFRMHYVALRELRVGVRELESCPE